ncbi:MAG: endolytic transglycosylase MltG [Patescibacteria group bacterium]
MVTDTYHWLKMKSTSIIVTVIAVLLIGAAYSFFLVAPQKSSVSEFFTLPSNSPIASLADKLSSEGFIKSSLGFRVVAFLRKEKNIEPGVYQLSKSMNAWKVSEALQQGPALKWVTIPEGLRKEQIADIFSENLGWSEQETRDWITTFSAMKFDYREGVYFPDTYLIPIHESPLDVAERLRRHFEEELAPYTLELRSQNIKWTTALTLASIVQREAAGQEDMALIAGILWNRLEKGMQLEVDATVQYARDTKRNYPDDPCLNTESTEYKEGLCGDEVLLHAKAAYVGGKGWWTPITPEDKRIVSEYNTYLNKGLPPQPIANPGIEAIRSVIFPAKTDCLYYLHDGLKNIHCAKTFSEHLKNIDDYLR